MHILSRECQLRSELTDYSRARIVKRIANNLLFFVLFALMMEWYSYYGEGCTRRSAHARNLWRSRRTA